MACVLIVDDDRDTCANLTDILLDFGYSVDSVNKGDDALKLVQRKRYATMLLDFHMPGLNGLELFRQIKVIQGDVQAILITGFATSAVQDAAISAGVRSILRKPLDAGQLLRVVQEIVSQNKGGTDSGLV